MASASKIIEDLKHQNFPVPPLNIHLDPYAPKPKREPLLTEREATHGSFTETARVAQELKTVMVQSAGFTKLNHAQREVLDMLATKIGRILSGDPHHHDHWDDLAGYSKLGREACE